MSRAEAIVDAALAHGTPRSAAYRQGAIAVLRFKLDGLHVPFPYRTGTAEADAYFAGNDRGWALWHRVQEDMRADGEAPSATCRGVSRNEPKKSAQSRISCPSEPTL